MGLITYFGTVKRRYWKNKVATLTLEEAKKLEVFRPGNVERMRQGKPPQRLSQEKLEKMELHHTPIPRRNDDKEFVELWLKEHEREDEFRHTGY